MSYLAPPPNMSPVVVVKDYGGYVNEYAVRTEEYRRTNREVRIHECHSACTMALSLPNVCVYPSSVFKFHQAYDPRNHVTNWEISDALFHTYPVAVRERLGTLNKKFTIIRGTELIQLGVRECGTPQPRIIMAAATMKPLPESLTQGGGSTFSMLTGRLQGMMPNLGARPELAPAPPGSRLTKRYMPPVPVPDGMLAPKIPVPPEKPAEIARIDPDADPATEPGGIPLPPRRPKVLVAYTPSLPPIPMLYIIEGAQPVLPARFVPFPKG